MSDDSNVKDRSRSPQLSLSSRASRVFPGAKWTRGPLQEPCFLKGRAFPQFLARGAGCRVWDTDGREFIDYLAAFGANVLGYNDPRVEAAARKTSDAVGQLLTGPTALSVELAERLVDLRPGVTWALFAKNGSDVTTLARVVARAVTGKRGVLREKAGGTFAYHGASPQWSRGKPGVVPEESEQFEVSYTYNDLDSVQQAIRSLDGDVAAIFVGGCSYPYSAPTEEPTKEFAQGLRQLADQHGALLVLDEIRTNCRVGGNLRGHWQELDSQGGPDLHCLCKAIANGHPLAALLGNDRARLGAAKMFATGTYWLSAPPMAAALATLDALEADSCKALLHMQEMGRKLIFGLEEMGQKHGLKLTMSGPPAMPLLTFDDEQPLHRPQGERWCTLMAEAGIWLHPHHNWYITASHSSEDIDRTLQAADRAFAVLASQEGRKSEGSNHLIGILPLQADQLLELQHVLAMAA